MIHGDTKVKLNSPRPPSTLGTMGLASWILAGLLAGLAAQAVKTYGPPGGCFGNAILGILGALSGGILATFLGFGGLLAFDGRSVATALLGALVLLLVGRLLRRPGSGGD
jgi:uncharacterized membrane protein YeaQ/YmgE (transglycosylase-associated protein family)